MSRSARYVVVAEGKLYQFLKLQATGSDLQRAESFFQEGLSADGRGDSIAAVQNYQMATQLNPQLVGAWLNLGNAWFDQRSFAVAERCYRRATEADPDDARPYYNLGMLLDRRRQLRGAIARYTQALALNPNFADAHFNIACDYELTWQYRNARKHYDAYLKYCGRGEKVFYLAIAKRAIRECARRDLLLVV